MRGGEIGLRKEVDEWAKETDRIQRGSEVADAGEEEKRGAGLPTVGRDERKMEDT